MNVCRSQRWGAALVMFLAGALVGGCSGRKQVPFGLQDADTPTELAATAEESIAELPVGTAFEPNQVEVPVAESTLVLQAGYALAALQLDLDGNEPIDALVVSADPQEVRLQAAYPRGLDVTARKIDSFLVPSDCTEPAAEIRQLSASLAGVRIEHACETGKRTNYWLVTIEAQPRVRERITVLPPNDRSTAPIELELGVEDRDADGYDDVVANVRIGDTDVPLAWLNRPGGFARDASQPEATLRELADGAWKSLDSDLAGAKNKRLLSSMPSSPCAAKAVRPGSDYREPMACSASSPRRRRVRCRLPSQLRFGAGASCGHWSCSVGGKARRPSPPLRNETSCKPRGAGPRLKRQRLGASSIAKEVRLLSTSGIPIPSSSTAERLARSN